MNYVTDEKIALYLKYRDPDKPIDLKHMANYFCKGAVTVVSNKLYERLEGMAYLALNYDWKNECSMWEIVDSETEEVIDSCEALYEWCKE